MTTELLKFKLTIAYDGTAPFKLEIVALTEEKPDYQVLVGKILGTDAVAVW